MRHNKFGDAYCHTADEARDLIGAADDSVYVTDISPPEGPWAATAEVVENGSGDLVCYLEADTEDKVRALVAELGLEIV